MTLKSPPTRIPKGSNTKLTSKTFSKKNLVVVGGPTASGKTSLAIEVARFFDTEIISADSRQFYKELTIGTAKPSTEELAQVKHHFIDSHSVTQEFNASDYGTLATESINSLFEKKSVVVMVGGSGLFIDAVIKGFDDLPGAVPEIRAELNSKLEDSGLETLQQMLLEKDPASYNRIDIKNPRRVVRALEVTLASGKPYSQQIQERDAHAHGWNIIPIGILHDRQDLYKRIDTRTKWMIENGLLEESKSVIGFRNHNALRTVGYKEMFMHLDGQITLAETESLIAQHTRNYAKRQMTWFKRYDDMIWFSPDEWQQEMERIPVR